MALSVVLAGMMDPLAVIAGMSAHLRDLGTETSADAADGARAEGEREDASRLECLRRAEKALKKAQSRMPKWAKKLISGILAAVGTIASCVTGGASLALVVVACVLMAAADVVDFLTEKGLIDAKVGMAISLTCKLAAAVCTFGAGFVNAGAAAAQVPQAVQTFKTISDLVSTATTIITAGFDVGRGVREFQGNMQQIKAEVHEGRRDDAHERMEECVSVMRASHERFVRVARSIQGALQAQGEVRAAAVMQPA
ncbi:MAG: hypothetical protein KC586_06555 [Myxococcales bacterium]|nr:hypothetical protein [Myxococcales bacterium]